jgi:hypothetical protein
MLMKKDLQLQRHGISAELLNFATDKQIRADKR